MANFYVEQEQSAQLTHNQVVEWLNEAALAADSNTKLLSLEKAKEVIINSSLDLLDNFLEEILNFQNDRNPGVRCFIVQFIEDACKKEPDILPKVVVTLQLLLGDQSPQVQKKVILGTTQLYKTALIWLSSAKVVTEEMETAWNALSDMKQKIIFMVDNDNDGIRTVSVKFLEAVILLQTYPESDSLRRKDDFSLEDVPFTLKIARRRKLEEEANMFFELLVKFHGSPHVSSLNLMTCMGSLVLIAKMRPQFMHRVVAALETLNINLPPTLFKSQVSSVRKHLRSRLLGLLKQPAAFELHPNITALLTDLGATPSEISKNMPKPEEVRRVRAKRAAEAAEAAAAAPAKKLRLDIDLSDDKVIDEDMEVDRVNPPTTVKTQTATDITEMFIFEKLTPNMTTNLILRFMPLLPDAMPPHFSSVFTPIAAAGTPGQIRHLARLLAAQITAASTVPSEKKHIIDELLIPQAPAPPSLTRETKKEEPTAFPDVPDPGKISRMTRLKSLKLSEITRPIGEPKKSQLLEGTVERILRAEKAAAEGGASATRSKIITCIGSLFHPELRQNCIEYISEDIKRRIDIGLAWLYEEHSFVQGYNRNPGFFKKENRADDCYNDLLCALILQAADRSKLDYTDRELILSRLYMEVPLITESAMDLLKVICCDEAKATMGLKLTEELIIRRPPRQMHLLNALLVQTSHENSLIRNEALERAVALYKRADLSAIIEEYAIFYLGFLRLNCPPDVLFGGERGRPLKFEAWTEETIRVCLYLFMAIMPINEKLIHELSRVYVATSAEVKRVILRLLEQPVRGMGMHSPELLQLLEECPKGAETLVTRIVHLLTDKAPPSPELVSRVRELYNTRVSDVRFLIPVLNGLRKEEVIAALPKLVKLTPAVVKEVFARLLSRNPDGSSASPLTPVDLLVALHVIDSGKCDLKLIIKATSLCFAERHIYTQEVLAMVLNALMEISPLPTLLMRTVIQALSFYPRLSGFIMNILQRLIHKRVWHQRKVWEGFIKCCQRTRPQSFHVLLQLPPAQLIDVFMECPDLQKPLLDHVLSFTEHQRKHISRTIMEILHGNKLVILDEEGEYPTFVPPAHAQPLPIIEVKIEKDPEIEPMEVAVPNEPETSKETVPEEKEEANPVQEEEAKPVENEPVPVSVQ